ncbi:MAG: FAD-dependent oxidoreductase [Polyangiaceae bacterium]
MKPPPSALRTPRSLASRSLASSRLRPIVAALALVLGCAEPPEEPETRAPWRRPGTLPMTSAAAVEETPPKATPATSATAAPTAPATSTDARASVSAPVPDKARVVVIGGGFAGLITAYKLRKAGVDVHLLEAQPRLGGRANTAYYPGGAQGEFGVQELWEDNPIYTTARELGVKFEDPDKREPGFTALYEVDDPAKKGEKKPVLYTYSDTLARQFYDQILAKDGKADPAAYDNYEKWLKTAAELRKRAIEKGLSDPEIARLQKMSFGEWLRESNLDPRLQEFVSMTLDCEVAITSEAYSALFGLLEFNIFLDDMKYFHAEGGNHKIVDAFAQGVGQEHITTSARVIRIDLPAKDKPGPGEINVHYMIDGHIGIVRAERVVMAIPWIRLHEIDIRPPLSAEKWNAIEGEHNTGKSKKPELPGLSRGKYVVVHFLVDRKAGDELWRDKKTNRTPFPILSNGKLGVIYGVKNEGDPKADTDVFSLLVYGEYANNLHMQPVHRVETMAVEELSRLWPGFGKIVKASYVYSYHPGAVPVWPPGRSPIDDASKSLWKPEHGLYLAGDYLVNAHSDGAGRSAICQSDRLLLDLAGKPAKAGLCHYIPGEAP